MNQKDVKRKLAAILSADVKGYSRLMEEDEVTTVLTLEEYRGVISGIIEKHRGRVWTLQETICWLSLQV